MCGSQFWGFAGEEPAMSSFSKFVVRSLVVLIILCATSWGQQKKRPNQPAEPGKAPQPATQTAGQPVSPSPETEDEQKGPWHGLTWRLVGPFRGGRVLAVTGVMGEA